MENAHAYGSEKEAHMITEVVTFKLPRGLTREKLITNYRQTAPKWRENPDLVRKNYLYDGTTDWVEEFTCGKIWRLRKSGTTTGGVKGL